MTIDAQDSYRGELPGSPSDGVPEILATGRSDIATLFLSMSERHPHGSDADYLRWHTLDHRPEQQRLGAVRTSLRVVSTPACRRVRAASAASFEAVDHVMTYFFTDGEGLAGFNALAIALHHAGRSPFVLPPVQRGVYTVDNRVAAPRARAGADVLPWRPVRGVYILVESGAAAPHALTGVPGVAGAWSAHSVSSPFSDAGAGQRLTFCFLDDDPVETAERLGPVLQQRWNNSGISPLLAAPFYAVVPYEWDRYLP